MFSTLFYKLVADDSVEKIPDNMKELKYIKPGIDVSKWNRGLLELSKNPKGLKESDRIVGIDPGQRDLIALVDSLDTETKAGRENHSWAISNAKCQERSGVKWAQQLELKARKHAEIQETYDTLLSPKVCLLSDFSEYIRSLSHATRKVHEFNKHYRHRERKGLLYSDRRIAHESIADTVIGLNPYNIRPQIQLAHKINKVARRKQRRRFRKANGIDTGIIKNRRTVVAYGDASIRSSMRGHPPLPQKGIQRSIARKALVIRVDEYYTSQKCSVCGNILTNIKNFEYPLRCSHMEKKVHLPKDTERVVPDKEPPLPRTEPTTNAAAKRKKRVKVPACLNQLFEFLNLTIDCPNRVRQAYRDIIYPIKICINCPGGTIYWGRYHNAARNMYKIMQNYIESGGNLSSRPKYLKRPAWSTNLAADEFEEEVYDDEESLDRLTI